MNCVMNFEMSENIFKKPPYFLKNKSGFGELFIAWNELKILI